MFDDFKFWFQTLFIKRTLPPPLQRMQLKPKDSPANPLMIQFFTWDCLHPEMSWWRHLEEEIPKLAEQGYTQIWLPPPNKAAELDGRGYDAYDLWDLGEFMHKGEIRTRWGTRDELLSACRTAREHGIDVLIDAVLNHKLGADRFETFSAVPSNPINRLRDDGPARLVDGWTAFDYPTRGNKYSSFHWRQEHFSGVDWDQKTRTKGVYRIGWSRNVDTELGNYDFLLGVDIDHTHPDVQEDLLKWGSWVLETTGAGGKFLLSWLQNVRARSGNNRLFCVDKVIPYLRYFRGEVSAPCTPFIHLSSMCLCTGNFHSASRQSDSFDLRQIFKKTIVGLQPGDAVTFVDNHESNNKADLHPQVIGQSLESWVSYALVLLRASGHPCVFYGDLYPNQEGYSERTANNLRILVEARKYYAYGPQQDYFTDKNCIGWVRKGDRSHPGCAVILSNKSGKCRLTFKCQANAGSSYRSLMTQGEKVVVDVQGWGTFHCFANTAQVWVKA
ncbi:glycoside hydrolase family 13 protein [Coprinellus micaceus]|uniref:Glycoside hydrolase family 13 protein n=1 Tax=Coprinellus micaceus TaxID=71717 RepID=A0A4Y7TGN6_COPMI|nr:glycoside hydrolase family 13 protein [Coprinellus micaceus]